MFCYVMFKNNKKEKLEYVFSICKAGSHNSAQVFLDLLNENESTQKESKVNSYNFIFQIDTTETRTKIKKRSTRTNTLQNNRLQNKMI